jgi:hypothetical protein
MAVIFGTWAHPAGAVVVSVPRRSSRRRPSSPRQRAQPRESLVAASGGWPTRSVGTGAGPGGHRIEARRLRGWWCRRRDPAGGSDRARCRLGDRVVTVGRRRRRPPRRRPRCRGRWCRRQRRLVRMRISRSVARTADAEGGQQRQDRHDDEPLRRRCFGRPSAAPPGAHRSSSPGGAGASQVAHRPATACSASLAAARSRRQRLVAIVSVVEDHDRLLVRDGRMPSVVVPGGAASRSLPSRSPMRR